MKTMEFCTIKEDKRVRQLAKKLYHLKSFRDVEINSANNLIDGYKRLLSVVDESLLIEDRDSNYYDNLNQRRKKYTEIINYYESVLQELLSYEKN